MNRNELIAQLAAEMSTTRAAVERMVGTVFSAIGDALARGEPTAIAGFGTFAVRSRAARRRRNMLPEPESPSTSPPPGRRRSRPRRPFETRSTPSMAQAAARYRPRPATFVAERGCREIRDSSPVRTHAQSRAELESPRARVPYMAGREFSLATVLLGSAQTDYWKCFLGAYGSHRLRAEAPHRTSRTKSPAPPSDRRRYVELPTTITSVTDTSARGSINRSCVPRCALYPYRDAMRPLP